MNDDKQTAYDVLISGAGPAGMTCAAMVHNLRPDLSICLLDAKASTTPNNARHLALSHGSVELLKACKLWPDSPEFGHAIHAVHVSQQGRLGHTMMRNSTLNVPELGWMLNYSALLTALTQSLHEQYPDIKVIRPDTILSIAPHACGHSITLASERQLTARLLVHAEGGVFHIQGTANHDTRASYEQTAMLCVVHIPQLPAHQAWERFTHAGPVAMLPLGGDRYSLVWCVKQGDVDTLMNASIAEKQTRLAHIFAGRFSASNVTFETTMQAYPLGMAWKEELTTAHTVTLGNAAQTLHPVAGQGLNLALRDCHTLAQQLAHAKDWSQAINDYSALRQRDRNTTKRVTDAMARVFATPKAIVQHTLGLGLLSLDITPPAKRWVGNSLLWGQR